MFVLNCMLYRLCTLLAKLTSHFSLMNKLLRSQMELQQTYHCVGNALEIIGNDL